MRYGRNSWMCNMADAIDTVNIEEREVLEA